MRRVIGPALIKGGPGTGKSTIALYRVRSVLDQAQKAGRPPLRLLFTTYTPALTRFSAQLLEQLLGERVRHVQVETADDLAQRIAETQEKVGHVAERPELETLLTQVLSAQPAEIRSTLARLRPDYLLDEIEWVIEGQALSILDQYLKAERKGRGIGLNESMRQAVWTVYIAFRQALRKSGAWSHSMLRLRALNLVLDGTYAARYDAVMIDEAQDLPPVALSLLVELARDATGVYLTADASQSIYFRGFSWQSVNDRLRFRGRTVNLRRNYRSTREIAEAATDFLKTTSCGDPESLMPVSVQNGPRPVLLSYDSEQSQWASAADFIRQMSRHLRLKPGAAAVLVPNAQLGETAAQALTALGLPARYMRGAQLNLAAPEVKVLTLNAAKGLEFPTVVVAGLQEHLFPRLPANVDSEELADELATARRTLFVGMTRAMRGLLLLYAAAKPSPFVSELRRELWYEGE